MDAPENVRINIEQNRTVVGQKIGDESNNDESPAIDPRSIQKQLLEKVNELVTTEISKLSDNMGVVFEAECGSDEKKKIICKKSMEEK